MTTKWFNLPLCALLVIGLFSGCSGKDFAHLMGKDSKNYSDQGPQLKSDGWRATDEPVAMFVPDAESDEFEEISIQSDVDDDAVVRSELEDSKPKKKRFSFFRKDKVEADEQPSDPEEAASLAKEAARVRSFEFARVKPDMNIKNPDIRPGHVLSVSVDVTGIKEVEEGGKRVSSAGYISLPLIGAVKVSGMDPAALAELLQKEYSEYLNSPMVDVAFDVDNSPGAVSPWGSVTVLGKVNEPGRINIPPTQDLTLSMAVQLAGGLADSAKDTAIKVTRQMADGTMTTREFNLRSAASQGEIENDILLHAGDIIYIPEKVF